MATLEYTIDATSGIAIVQPSRGFRAPYVTGVGTVTYRCHSCGDLIPKWWEVFYFDPADEGWASYVSPAVMPPTMTTHHDWHMSALTED